MRRNRVRVGDEVAQGVNHKSLPLRAVLASDSYGVVGLEDMGVSPKHQVGPLLNQELGHLLLVAVLLGVVLPAPVGDYGDQLDKGIDGLNRTLDVLDEAGLPHVGTYRSQEEREWV